MHTRGFPGVDGMPDVIVVIFTFFLVLKSKVRSLGWNVGQKDGPEKEDLDLPAPDGEVVDRKERHQEKESYYKSYKTFLSDVKDEDQEKLRVDLGDEKPWNLTGFSLDQGKERRLADLAGLEAEPGQKKLFPLDMALSDEGRSHRNESAPPADDLPHLKKTEMSLSHDKGSNTLIDGFTSTFARSSRFGSTPGFRGDIPPAGDPMGAKCSDIMCGAVTGALPREQEPLEGQKRDVATFTDIESLSPSLGKSSSGLRDGGVQLATSHLRGNPPVFSEVRVSDTGGLELRNWNNELWSEEHVCFNRSTSDNISVRAVDSLSSEGHHGDDVMIRGHDSNKAAGSKRWICLNKELKLDQSTDGSWFNKEPEAQLDTTEGALFFGSGLKDGVNSNRSTTVTFGSSSDTESSRLADRQWAEVLPDWNMQSLKVVVKQTKKDDPGH